MGTQYSATEIVSQARFRSRRWGAVCIPFSAGGHSASNNCIIQNSGVFCQREPLRYQLCRRGGNSFANALSIASLSISGFHKSREPMRNCEGCDGLLWRLPGNTTCPTAARSTAVVINVHIGDAVSRILAASWNREGISAPHVEVRNLHRC